MEWDFWGSSNSFTLYESSASFFTAQVGPSKVAISDSTNYNFASRTLYRQTFTTSASYYDYGLYSYNSAISLSMDGYVLSNGYLMRSDQRLKQNIKPLRFDVARCLSLDAVRFNWVSSNEADIGFTAQSVIKRVTRKRFTIWLASPQMRLCLMMRLFRMVSF